MAGYDPTSIIRASIFLAFLSISLFAVFLSCKDRCLFYEFGDNYWLPLWVGILGMFLGVFGVAMGCSKRSNSRSPPCVGTVFCEFIFVFTFACLGCLLIITRPILALYSHVLNIQIANITYVTDLVQRNVTAIEDFDAKYTDSFILWGILAGIAMCLAFLSFCMSCMYCCCCQEESPPPLRQPTKPKVKTKDKKSQGKQTHSADRSKIEMTTATHISPPTKRDARPPPFAPSLSGDTSKDAFLFPNASAPHPTLARDKITAQVTSSGNSIQPVVPNTPVHTVRRPTDTPPDVPTSPRPSLTKQNNMSSNDRHDDDDVAYVLPNNPIVSTTDSAYLLPQPATGEYIEPIGDGNYEQLNDYNYAYEHDVETLARRHGPGAAGEPSNSVSQPAETYTETATNITKNDRLDEYNYPYEHEIETLARNHSKDSDGVSYY